MAIFENVTGGTWSPWPWFSPDPGYVSPYRITATADPLKLWRTQPSIRKVVGYIARETAQLPWHAFRRVHDSDRVRLRGSDHERLLSSPSARVTGYRLLRDLVIDLMLFDRCLAVAVDGELLRFSPRLWEMTGDNLGQPMRVLLRQDGQLHDITDAPMLITWGWSDSSVGGISPMLTLADLVEESRRSVEWRRSLWEDGPKFSGYLRHPGTFRSSAARDTFQRSWAEWRDQRKGTPILEDGMDYQVTPTPSPKDAQDLEGRTLTDIEVASAFHIPPELVGARSANYSNMHAFRSMLFGPVLGPMIIDLEQAANRLLQDMFGDPDVYVELSREAAINGSLVEQAGVLQTMTGGPIMLRSEARARLNLPFVEGTEELIVPLNVAEGGQASPTDSGSQNVRFGFARKAVAKAEDENPSSDKAGQRQRDRLERELQQLLTDQEEELADDALEVAAFTERWEPESAKRILPHLSESASLAAARAVRDLGIDDWDDAVMDGYLEEMSKTFGSKVTAGTVKAVEEADDRADAFDALRNSAVTFAGACVADAMGFAGNDVARHGGAAVKTWITTSPNPRDSHARMNGETVPIDERFSNGARWPGDDSLDVEETACCRCTLEYSWEER